MLDRNEKKILVSNIDVGKRLDVFLAEKLGQTRSQIQNMITAGLVLVNGTAPKKTGVKLSLGDVICIIEPQAKSYQLKAKSYPEILSDTPDTLIVNKPSGMVVHATAYEHSGTLVDWLLEHYPSIRGVGDDPLRPGIVHRLDKDASGVMVIAKTQDSFDSLKRQFKLRRVSKEYLILVYGTVTPAEGRIDLPITRPTSHSTRFVASRAAGRSAITNYRVEKIFDGFSLVRALPETGRTHQIRVHFYSRGYPLVGDTVYASSKIKKQMYCRLMLHACLLEFRDLSGAIKRYECPLGEDFTSVVASLQSR